MQWSGTTWTALGVVVAAVAALVTIIALLVQLRDTRRELQDKRIDEKIKGVIGENILLVNNLTEQAKTTLEQARESATAIQAIRAEVEHESQGLQTLQEQITQDRGQLERVVAEARLLAQNLNRTAEQAAEDAEVIIRARSLAEINEELMMKVEQVLTGEGYEITRDSFKSLRAASLRHLCSSRFV